MEATMTEEQEKLFDKYERICEKLLEHNIELTNITGMGPELTNMTTGKKNDSQLDDLADFSRRKDSRVGCRHA